MKNILEDKINSTIRLNITGKNVNNYVKRLIKEKISIIKLIPVSQTELEIIISYSDYLKLSKKKSIYKIIIKDKYGKIKYKEKLKLNKILILTFLLGITLIVFLSNIIFEVKVIHTNSNIRAFLYQELKKYDIKPYSKVKSFMEIEKIEKEILDNNKNKIEWLEIQRIGTKYEVKLEERLFKKDVNSYQYQSIVATKNAVLTRINAYKGEKNKEINDYVKKGDVVISGYVTRPDGTMELTKATGTIYGEVWYNVFIEYPYYYNEELLTGEKKEVYVINFIGKRFSLFDFNKFNTFKSDKKTIIKNNLVPINLTKEKQYALKIISEIYTKEEAREKALAEVKNKLLNQNSKIIKINDITIIGEKDLSSKIELNLFVNVQEEITEIKEETNIIQQNE